MSQKCENVCRTFNYLEHFIVFIFAVSDCISISAFALLLGVLEGTASSAVSVKVCAITAGIKSYKSIVKKKKKNSIVYKNLIK